jgi:phosphoserine-tRNA(Cys) ligase (EC 6.1.1.-)
LREPRLGFLWRRKGKYQTLRTRSFNEIFVYRGAVLGVPDTEKGRGSEERNDDGHQLSRAISLYAAARIEAQARCGRQEVVQVKMARTAADINIALADYALRYITGEKKKIDVRGPVFLTIRSETE